MLFYFLMVEYYLHDERVALLVFAFSPAIHPSIHPAPESRTASDLGLAFSRAPVWLQCLTLTRTNNVLIVRFAYTGTDTVQLDGCCGFIIQFVFCCCFFSL
jgi:hypothetical protein